MELNPDALNNSNFTVEVENRIDQFNSIDICLEITQQEDLIPRQWILKSYNMSPESVNAAFLEDEAANEISRLVDEWNNLNP